MNRNEPPGPDAAVATRSRRLPRRIAAALSLAWCAASAARLWAAAPPPPPLPDTYYLNDRGAGYDNDRADYVMDGEDAAEGGGPRRSLMMRTLDEAGLMEGIDSDAIREAALALGDGDDYDENIGLGAAPAPALAPYDLLDVVRESEAWESSFAILVYDPDADVFAGFYSAEHKKRSSNQKLWNAFNHLANLLRMTFPERFQKGAPEFVVAVGGGDYPHVRRTHLPRTSGVGPVLLFGSVFRNVALYPNLVAMPMPGIHLGCFVRHARDGGKCAAFGTGPSATGPRGALAAVSPEESWWDDLVPQVAWRGTDFGYLAALTRPRLFGPLGNRIEEVVANRKAAHESDADRKAAATAALREHYDILRPRWKGAVLTAEAELEFDAGRGRGGVRLPWANIKFSHYIHDGRLAPTVGSQRYREYDEVGVAAGRPMSRRDLARHRYQIDLGGGGGTTWTGTLEKLGMPGLLFHHVTPTKDYLHNLLRPWVHYVPVRSDLTDLREKYDWAEGHPDEAARISHRATEFVRRLGTEEGLADAFREVVEAPLRRVVDAYVPVAERHPGRTWREVLASAEGGGGVMVQAVECGGFTLSCDDRGNGKVRGWGKKRWGKKKRKPFVSITER